MGWLTCCESQSKEEKIVELDFSRCGVADVPHEVYSNSPTLELLHLEGNKLKDLSPQLFQCIDLRYLNVSDNEIRSIPPLISKLSNLQVLNLSKNSLTLDGLHNNLGKLSKLTVLDLSMNDLGKVAESLMSLINLQQLCLNDTGIDFIPANIGRLINLRVLELRDNNLRELPKSIRRLTNLQQLDVSDNCLTNLEQVGEAHGNLTELWINGNNISELSLSITYLKKMNDFDASCNNLESVPKEIGHWTKITNLILSFNSLKSLPKAIGNLRNLQVMKLESNYLTELPNTISKLINLEELNLQNNSLIAIPVGIGHLRKLATLILSDNKITQLPAEIGSCVSLSILNIHNNRLTNLPEEIGHLINLTTLGLIGNQLTYLPITISKLTNLKALWLTPNQTQPLIHLQSEHLNDGQIVLTSIVFPQAPIKDIEIAVMQPAQQPQTQSSHITFSTERDIDLPKSSNLSLNRIPTPHHKELKRLREILRSGGNVDNNLVANISQIKEAKVTHIVNDLNESQLSLNGSVELNSKQSAKRPPPYHIAAAYSKNAHLFSQVSPPSPLSHDQPKQFSQEQPANIHMPTPKLANGTYFQPIQALQVVDGHKVHFDNNEQQAKKWPFGSYKVCQVIEVELQGCRTENDFEISVSNEGLFIENIEKNGAAYYKLLVGDKILSFDDTDYTIMDPNSAYHDAVKRISTVKTVTVSRFQNT